MHKSRIAGYLNNNLGLEGYHGLSAVAITAEQRNEFFDELDARIAETGKLHVGLEHIDLIGESMTSALEQFGTFDTLLKSGMASGTYSREVIGLVQTGLEAFREAHGVEGIVVPGLESFSEKSDADIYGELVVSNEGMIDAIKRGVRKVSSSWSKATIKMNKENNTKFVEKIKNIAGNLKKDLLDKKFDAPVTISIGNFGTQLGVAGNFPKNIPDALKKDAASLSYLFGDYAQYSFAYYKAIWQNLDKLRQGVPDEEADAILNNMARIQIPQAQIKKEIQEGKTFIQNITLELSAGEWAEIRKAGSAGFFDAFFYQPTVNLVSAGEISGAPEELTFSKADVEKLIDGLNNYVTCITESNAMWADVDKAIMSIFGAEMGVKKMPAGQAKKWAGSLVMVLFSTINSVSKTQTQAQAHALGSVKIATRLIESVLAKVSNGKSAPAATEEE